MAYGMAYGMTPENKTGHGEKHAVTCDYTMEPATGIEPATS